MSPQTFHGCTTTNSTSASNSPPGSSGPVRYGKIIRLQKKAELARGGLHRQQQHEAESVKVSSKPGCEMPTSTSTGKWRQDFFVFSRKFSDFWKISRNYGDQNHPNFSRNALLYFIKGFCRFSSIFKNFYLEDYWTDFEKIWCSE